MKLRLLALLLAILMLCGCVSTGPESTDAPGTSSSQGFSEATEPSDATKPSESSEPTAPTEPAPTETQPTEPAPTEPQPTEPAPTEPAPTEPQPTEPEPTEPLPQTDPYVGVSKDAFYADYKPAANYMDAYYRSQHGFLSGSLEVPGQYATESSYLPTQGGKYLRNTDAFYADNGNTYIVVDAWGREVMRIYKDGGYITLEEVAAYMYAFGGKNGSLPANYTSKKSGSPSGSIWGEYLRLNHSYFSGDTDRYPYEPVLPDISGCGGSLQYYEMDIGTTGTVTPGYGNSKPYNNGSKITRGAARLVYTRYDKNRNGVYETDEIYVFYTHNHYNDFREYLNYYGGWGMMFGNITGGGTYNSTTNYNPTRYPVTGYAAFSEYLENAA